MNAKAILVLVWALLPAMAAADEFLWSGLSARVWAADRDQLDWRAEWRWDIGQGRGDRFLTGLQWRHRHSERTSSQIEIRGTLINAPAGNRHRHRLAFALEHRWPLPHNWQLKWRNRFEIFDGERIGHRARLRHRLEFSRSIGGRVLAHVHGLEWKHEDRNWLATGEWRWLPLGLVFRLDSGRRVRVDYLIRDIQRSTDSDRQHVLRWNWSLR